MFGFSFIGLLLVCFYLGLLDFDLRLFVWCLLFDLDWLVLCLFNDLFGLGYYLLFAIVWVVCLVY